MSLVSLVSWQMQNIDNMYRGQASFMGASQGLMNMLSNPLQYSPLDALNAEKRLMNLSFLGQTAYKYSAAQEDYVQKMLDKSIKRSFSYFA